MSEDAKAIEEARKQAIVSVWNALTDVGYTEAEVNLGGVSTVAVDTLRKLGWSAPGEVPKHDDTHHLALSGGLPAMSDSDILHLTDRDRVALPAERHLPMFHDLATPKSWNCAVCWGEGWTTAWPCESAIAGGREIDAFLRRALR